MNTTPKSPTSHARRRAVAASAAVSAIVLLATAGCAGNLVHSYRSFQSALDRGASCSELFDQRARFDDEDTLAKIDRDLDRIGCTSPDATRTD
jgi:ADP-ribosylglycohydrolase